MPRVEETKNAKRAAFSIEDREALIQHAKKVSLERSRVEAERLKEQITARQKLLESLKPEDRARMTEHLKMYSWRPAAQAPVVRENKLPPPTCISYQVMRPPFTNFWGTPSLAQTPCVNAFTSQSLGLSAVSEEGIASEGALSVQAAIGDFFNARCQRIGSWFIGEGNRAFAAIGLQADSGVALPSSGFMSIEVDLAMEGEVGWSNFLFPGDPSSGLGLVGFIGIGTLIFQTFDSAQQTTQETYERFLLGSASAYFPGQVDREPAFTRRLTTFLSPTPAGETVRYAFSVSADLTAFRTTPEGQGYPGFAHANLTVPGTPGPLQPGTPLMVQEIRTGICLL